MIQNLEIFRHDECLNVTIPGTNLLEPTITWHGTKLNQPDWREDSHSLALTLCYRQYGELLHVILNAFWEPLTFELPLLKDGQQWQRIVDTALAAPDDFCPIAHAPKVLQPCYRVNARSSVILIAESW